MAPLITTVQGPRTSSLSVETGKSSAVANDWTNEGVNTFKDYVLVTQGKRARFKAKGGAQCSMVASSTL
jgi:hypothetical protein